MEEVSRGIPLIERVAPGIVYPAYRICSKEVVVFRSGNVNVTFKGAALVGDVHRNANPRIMAILRKTVVIGD